MYEFLIENTSVASALAATMRVIIAFLALLASSISIYVSVTSLKHQKKNNTLSVSPIPEITVADYENSLRGSGPLIIKSLTVTKGAESKSDIVKWMRKLPENRPWTHFATDLNNRSIMPGDFIPLLELTEAKDDSNFSEARDLCRVWLKELSCTVIYTDVYETNFSPYTKSLNWFGRNV